MAAPPRIDLDQYREGVDAFSAEIEDEYYLHYSGQKETYELEAIYARYAELVSLETCVAFRNYVHETPSPSAMELWRFACEGRLGDLTREQEERLALAESKASAIVGDEEIPYRMLRPTISNEPDRARREELERGRADIVERELVPLHRESYAKTCAGIEELGGGTLTELYKEFGFPLDLLERQVRAFLTDTEDLYVASMDALCRRRLQLGLDEVRRWDLPRLFRAPDWDAGFRASDLLPALSGTLSDLGIDLSSQRNVHLDLEARPNKSPRAFCSAIEVPGRIMLVVQPMGGVDDWSAVFHEAGHAQHFAHTASSLPVEWRRLGDDAVTEGWAFLLMDLVRDPAWLSRRLDFGRPLDFAAEASAVELYLARRLCAKFCYELELGGSADPDSLRDRYVEELREATKIESAAVDFLADVDAGFYVTKYLRAWGFEAQIRTFLREEFGNTWFTQVGAGSLLRELWYEGQSMNADQILEELVGSKVELGSSLELFEEHAMT